MRRRTPPFLFPCSAMLALLLFALAAPPAAAQAIQGRILDAAVGQPVIGATVALLDAQGGDRLFVQSDSSGWFYLPVPAPGQYSIRIERIGYRATHTQPVEVAAQELVEVKIELGVEPVALSPLQVTARRRVAAHAEFQRRLERARITGQGHIISRQELERSNHPEVTGFLARVPQVQLRFDATGHVTPIISSRARTTPDMRVLVCVPDFYLDGARVEVGYELFIDDLVRPSDLEGIEVYRSPHELPVELSRPGACGAIVAWTRLGETGRTWSWKRNLIGGSVLIALLLAAFGD